MSPSRDIFTYYCKFISYLVVSVIHLKTVCSIWKCLMHCHNKQYLVNFDGFKFIQYLMISHLKILSLWIPASLKNRETENLKFLIKGERTLGKAQNVGTSKFPFEGYGFLDHEWSVFQKVSYNLVCLTFKIFKDFEKVGRIFRLVNETRVIALMQAGMLANHFAHAIDHAGNITNFTKNCTGKSFFFSQDSRKGISGKHPICGNIHIYVFIKVIIRKTNCYWHVRFFFDLY